MLYPSVTTPPFLQTARTYVKGYVNLHGFTLRFETTRLDRCGLETKKGHAWERVVTDANGMRSPA